MNPRLWIGNRNYSSWSLRAWLCLKWAGVDFDETLIDLDQAGYGERRIAQVLAEAGADVAIAIAGHSVIIDAVYSAPDERAAVEDLARLLRVPFNGLWLEADHAILFARIETRRGDASDATIDVAQRQIEHGADALGWTRLDASLEPELVLAAAKRLLGL